MGLDFTSVDFETANHHRASPCAVGLARVRDGQVVDSTSWLMKPPPGFDQFHPYNVGIHGITSLGVAGAPSFADSLGRIVDYIGDDVVCAHNARFDNAVLHMAASAIGAPSPSFRWVCTLRAARMSLQLPSYRLPFVADALGTVLIGHHDAHADAIAVALIVPGLANRLGVSDLDSLAAATQAVPWRPTPLPTADTPRPGADEDHPLWNRVIVFTGALSTLTRREAHEQCIDVGARPEPGVTKRTNVLVIGDLDPARLVPGDVTSQKAQKAFKLRSEGQDIEVMTEHDLLRHL